jgi:hypothetical protein
MSKLLETHFRLTWTDILVSGELEEVPSRTTAFDEFDRTTSFQAFDQILDTTIFEMVVCLDEEGSSSSSSLLLSSLELSDTHVYEP